MNHTISPDLPLDPMLRTFFLVAFALTATTVQANPPSDDNIANSYSRQPALKWEDGMVTGNGLIGSLHYGPPERQVIVYNSHKFLVPSGAPFPVPDMADQLDELRDGMLAGRIGPAYQKFHDEFLRRRGLPVVHKPYYGMVSSQPFHAGYQLEISITNAKKATNFRRWTDYQTGEVISRWTDGNATWTSRSFASRADDVLVTELSAEGARLQWKLSLDLPAKAPRNLETQTSLDVLLEGAMLNFRAKYPKQNDKRAGYEGVTRLVASGRSPNFDGVDGKKFILNDDEGEAVLLLTKLERYRNDLHEWDKKKLQIELSKIKPDYQYLLERHTKIHKPIYDRVTLSLGEKTLAPLGRGQGEGKTNTELLAAESENRDTVNLALLERLFATSRYLFLSSSGKDYAPRLSGMFSGSWNAAWAGDYTCDSNVNMAVFGGNIADLPECMEGYFAILERTMPQWREAAKNYYGCRGILGPVRIDGEYAIPIHAGPYHAHFTATGLGPWLLYPLWENYQITGDKTFLRERLHPLLVEQAHFYEDFLTRTDDDGPDSQGHYIFVPSNSPENAWGKIQPRTSAAINSVMDIAACKHALTILLQAEKELDFAPSESTARWQQMLTKLPPYLRDEEGVLKEWAWKTYGENRGHRHLSHMYPLWPAYEVNPENPGTKHLMPAMAKAIQKRPQGIVQAHGGLQKAIGWLRLKNGEEFGKVLKYFLENGYFYDSLCSSHNRDHKIYNYDLVLCLQGLLIEAIVFTDSDYSGETASGVVELLPALPAYMSQGKLTGVKARCQATIDSVAWNLEERWIRLAVTSDKDQVLVIRHREGIKKIESNVDHSTALENAFTVNAKAGEPVEVKVGF